ncbi:ObirOr5-V11 [Ooceraea biroi]|uniref:Odorant receptor n=1 Tax=Ooceraea biroi TaxID=2015173 RepID=A0A026WNC9_OOCBI|nr:odorant receptor 4 isoform X1 [Ooceraea biroi]EZA57540.1 hypothetical protein X777_02075 [Ooceraea biroi]RLU24766.1 ObirOr5-V11 [Ooceraea biroi]
MKLENTISQVTRVWLEIFGMWPNSSCIFLRRIFWVVALIFEQVGQYQYIIMHLYSTEISELMNHLSAAMSFTLFCIKLVVFWYKQRTFKRLLVMMAIDWEKCFNEEVHIFATTNNVKLSQRFANMTVVLFSIAVILYSSNILHTGTDKTSNASITQPLILEMELPFHYNRRFVYELVIIAQFFHLWLCSCAIGLLNALLINLILHVSGQIDILREWVMKIFSKEKGRGASLFMIKKAIRKHQKIITFSEHIEDLYSNIAMALFVSDTLIICCLGFIMVTSIGTSDAARIIIRTVLFYFVINMEAFIFCFAGEYLSAKSQSIGDAAYDTCWYDSYSTANRIIPFLIMRSQNQLTITIGKVTNLSLERFTNIIRVSASYVSVLLAMY